MTLTRSIVNIKAAWLRVPLWSLYFPLYIIPDFIVYSLLRRGGLARMMRAECWHFMFAVYISGLDGWGDD